MKLKEKLFEIRKKIKPIKKAANNPFFNSKYFDINSLLGEVMPMFQEQKLLLLQPLVEVNGQLALETMVIDIESDEAISTKTVLPPQTDPQKAGSTITYYRRYALQSLLALEAEDDDGNASSGGKKKPAAKASARPVDTDEPPFPDKPEDGKTDEFGL